MHAALTLSSLCAIRRRGMLSCFSWSSWLIMLCLATGGEVGLCQLAALAAAVSGLGCSAAQSCAFRG